MSYSYLSSNLSKITEKGGSHSLTQNNLKFLSMMKYDLENALYSSFKVLHFSCFCLYFIILFINILDYMSIKFAIRKI